MNIFVLDEDPAVAAQMLCDCHVRKMCIETAEVLSGVMIRRNLPLLDGMPKPQNINHPVIVAADNKKNISWVIGYNAALITEFRHRFQKEHSYEKLVYKYAIVFLALITDIDCSNLTKCCGNLDVSGLDIVSAYRKYYTEVKKPQLQSKGLWKFTNRKDWTE